MRPPFAMAGSLCSPPYTFRRAVFPPFNRDMGQAACYADSRASGFNHPPQSPEPGNYQGSLSLNLPCLRRELAAEATPRSGLLAPGL